MKKYFSREALDNIIKDQEGTIRFSTKPDSKSILIETDEQGSFEYDFEIQEEHKKYYLKDFEWHEDGNEPSENIICIDQYVANRKKGSRILLEKACFIYDKRENPLFVIGFDPHNGDAWQSSSTTGVSIKAEKLTHKFVKRNGDAAGFEGIDFSIRPAEFVGVYGGSGTGKTLLLESILAPEYHAKGLLGQLLTLGKKALTNRIKTWINKKEICNGKVEINGNPPWEVIDDIAYLPQHIDFPEKMTCQEILELALGDRHGVNPKNEITEKMKLCSLEEGLLDRRYKALSGGQKRRIALAAALMKRNAKLLIADEPTTGLDVASEEDIMNTLRRISRNGITVIAVTHSVAALRIFDRVLVLRKNGERKGKNGKKTEAQGAGLSFNGFWHEDFLPDTGANKTQDAKVLRRLTETSPIDYSNENKKNCDCIWPFSEREQDSQILAKGLVNLLNGCTKTIKQACAWSQAITKLVVRDTRTLIIFAILAVACTLTIQVGVNSTTYRNWQVLLLCLLSLVSPWLCATYSAVLSSNQLKFFSWESFSGLKSLGFVLGIFAGQILPVLLISGIFSFGLLFAGSNKTIAAKLTKHLEDTQIHTKFNGTYSLPFGKSFNITKSEFHTKDFLKDDAKETADEDLKMYSQDSLLNCPMNDLLEKIANHESEFPLQANYTSSDQENNKITKRLADNWIFRKINEAYEINYHGFLIWLRAWLGMFIVSLSGAALGILATAIFRKAQSSTLFLVVMFVFFLSFSRLFIVKNGVEFLGPLSDLAITESSKFDNSSAIECLLPIALSFISLSRYAVNLILSLFFYFAWLDFWVIIILFTTIPLYVSSLLYSNKKKNWRLLSR